MLVSISFCAACKAFVSGKGCSLYFFPVIHSNWSVRCHYNITSKVIIAVFKPYMRMKTIVNHDVVLALRLKPSRNLSPPFNITLL
jgi:hypothetical protein